MLLIRIISLLPRSICWVFVWWYILSSSCSYCSLHKKQSKRHTLQIDINSQLDLYNFDYLTFVRSGIKICSCEYFDCIHGNYVYQDLIKNSIGFFNSYLRSLIFGKQSICLECQTNIIDLHWVRVMVI